MAQMAFEVEEAVAEIRAAFPENEVLATPLETGGAEVVVEDVDLTERYEPRTTFIGFRIEHSYPYSDVYPHFVRPDLRKSDGTALPSPGMTPNQQWPNQPAIMVSRRSNRWDSNKDTALGKLHKVIEWIRHHP